jgi:hypothetical protein
MLKVKSVSYLEFLYGVYPTDVDAGINHAVSQAVERVTAIRSLEIVPEIANEKSKNRILRNLEDATGLAMDYNDVWTDRTTTFNQFRYFRRHLELFDNVFFDEMNIFKFRENGEREARDLLRQSSISLTDLDYGSTWWLDN